MLLGVPAATLLTWETVPRVLKAKSIVRTTLYVAAKPPTISSSIAVENRIDFATYQRTQIALVKSRLVLNAALGDPKVMGLTILREQPNPVDWVEKQIKADYKIAPEILSISMTGDQPEELSILVEAVRDAYLREIVNREHNELNTRLEALKDFYSAKEKIVSRRRQTLRGLAQALGSHDALTLSRTQQYLLDRLGAPRTNCSNSAPRCASPWPRRRCRRPRRRPSRTCESQKGRSKKRLPGIRCMGSANSKLPSARKCWRG